MTYILLINLTGLLLMFLDKRYAKLNKRRISEKTLFAAALLGGSIGIWISMYLFRHKTRKLSFVLGIPVIFIIQLILLLRYL